VLRSLVREAEVGPAGPHAATLGRVDAEQRVAAPDVSVQHVGSASPVASWNATVSRSSASSTGLSMLLRLPQRSTAVSDACQRCMTMARRRVPGSSAVALACTRLACPSTAAASAIVRQRHLDRARPIRPQICGGLGRAEPKLEPRARAQAQLDMSEASASSRSLTAGGLRRDSPGALDPPQRVELEADPAAQRCWRVLPALRARARSTLLAAAESSRSRVRVHGCHGAGVTLKSALGGRGVRGARRRVLPAASANAPCSVTRTSRACDLGPLLASPGRGVAGAWARRHASRARALLGESAGRSVCTGAPRSTYVTATASKKAQRRRKNCLLSSVSQLLCPALSTQ
jgi:hypothetical protein